MEQDTLTEEELLELMQQRGLEKLEEHQKFVLFDGSIVVGDTKYVYGKDFFLGDYVTVYSTKLGKYANLQVTSVTKTYSDGVEHLDIEFGKDRLKVSELFSNKE